MSLRMSLTLTPAVVAWSLSLAPRVLHPQFTEAAGWSIPNGNQYIPGAPVDARAEEMKKEFFLYIQSLNVDENKRGGKWPLLSVRINR
jgi:hypothetical protein